MQFSTGSMFINGEHAFDGEFTYAYCSISATEEPVYDIALRTPLDRTCEIKCSTIELDVDALSSMTKPINNKFTVEFETPIMINARWHKKPRIRKKWLKRYGMKRDMLKFQMVSKEIVVKQTYGDDTRNVELSPTIIIPVFTEYQKRNGIVIEYV